MVILLDKKILIADDEEDILNLLSDYFHLNDYQVLKAKSGAEAIKLVEDQPDIILLDINLPDMSGYEVCSKIRQFINSPILFLTARTEDIDRIKGFNSGADDYIVKPFSLDVLGARISAHLRRESRNQTKTEKKFFGNMTIDYSSKLVYIGQDIINFPKKEFEIIELLSINPSQVFDKESIYEKIWGLDSMGDANVVAEHIRRIRSKILKYSDVNYIETVWGVGYKWVR